MSEEIWPPLRDDLLLGLTQRGYVLLPGRFRVVANLPPGYDEFASPDPGTGRPLTACPHSILLGPDGDVHILREGAALGYAIKLPIRTIELLLTTIERTTT